MYQYWGWNQHDLVLVLIEHMREKHKYQGCSLGRNKEVEMSDKTLAIVFLLGTLGVAVIASLLFPTMSGLP
jgi:hypothetical protein